MKKRNLLDADPLAGVGDDARADAKTDFHALWASLPKPGNAFVLGVSEIESWTRMAWQRFA